MRLPFLRKVLHNGPRKASVEHLNNKCSTVRGCFYSLGSVTTCFWNFQNRPVQLLVYQTYTVVHCHGNLNQSEKLSAYPTPLQVRKETLGPSEGWRDFFQTCTIESKITEKGIKLEPMSLPWRRTWKMLEECGSYSSLAVWQGALEAETFPTPIVCNQCQKASWNLCSFHIYFKILNQRKREDLIPQHSTIWKL